MTSFYTDEETRNLWVFFLVQKCTVKMDFHMVFHLPFSDGVFSGGAGRSGVRGQPVDHHFTLRLPG